MDDFEKLINASDLIEWIMETYPDWCVGDVRSIVDHVEDMPSSEPEIIRCMDCKWWDFTPDNTMLPDWHRCRYFGKIHTRYEDFCSRGERRTE